MTRKIMNVSVIGTGVIGTGWIIRCLAHNKKVIAFDKDIKLDGIKRKKLDTSLATRNGWKAEMNFSKSLLKTIENFKLV